jgi:3-methyladenine DNA glycosylase/8-oxoguanine DNA glycosylase
LVSSVSPAPVEVEIEPPWPFRLARRGGGDGVTQERRGVVTRLLHVGDSPILVHAWQPARRRVLIRAERVDPQLVTYPRLTDGPDPQPAQREQLELAVERMRFALGVDQDYTAFRARFRRDPLLGPLIRRHPHVRPGRRPWPWEALAWAVTQQLIETTRAAAIQRRFVRSWGPRLGEGRWALRDVPSAAVIAGRAPAEMTSMDLASARSIALRRVAVDVAAERADLGDPAVDARLQSISGIGPWTVQCLGLFGRGDPDSLPAGDLAYVKLVGRLAGLGRRATVEEVERFYEPYAPFRGLAGVFTLAGLHKLVAKGPSLRIAA